MKILITGSSGFIGSHLVELLSAQGHEIVGLDLIEPVIDCGLAYFYKADVCDKSTIMPALQGVECVIHLAAVHFDYGHEPDEYWRTNRDGTQQLVDAVDELDIKKFLFCSTIAIYGQRSDESYEHTEPEPNSPYGASKLAAENIVKRWIEDDHSRNAVILRPCAVYGERNITNMNNLIRQIDSGFFVKFGTGENIKATAYVGNVVRAIQHCLDLMEPGLKVLNYADKPDFTVNKVISIICDELNKKRPLIAFPLWMGVLAASPFSALTKITGRNFPVNIKRVRKLSLPTRVSAQAIKESGFEQHFTPQQGLQRTVCYYLANKNKKVSNYAYSYSYSK